MIRALAKPCISDSDYARFARFYIQGSMDFHNQYSTYEAIIYLMETIRQTKVLLFENEEKQVVGFLQYRYEDESATVFFESAILSEEYRSSRFFYEGFQDLVKHIFREYEAVKSFRFHVLAENRYLNRLYSKFAHKTGEREGELGVEHVFSVERAELSSYLRI